MENLNVPNLKQGFARSQRKLTQPNVKTKPTAVN
jgi:hypothetical protein